MNNQRETIRKFVSYINNPDHLGGFWLPNIQRHFVWSTDQIERLYDSILREYPIGTLLVWKNNSGIKHRKFIDNWHNGLNIMDFFVPSNEDQKMLVLDGQQRMQSLYIGLKGSYEGKELYFNVLSGDIKAPDDKRFEFKFYDEHPGFPWIRFSKLVFPDKKNKEFKQEIKELAVRDFTGEEDDRLEDNIELIRKVFCADDNILYQEVDSIDRPNAYTEDDIVEIFIRANSGGTTLNKSDLMFSLLISSWDDAEENMSDLLNSLNQTGYEFTRDFVLKTCLVLLDKGARYNVDKFREEDTREKILDNWERISKSIKNVKDFVYGNTFLKTDKNIPSYLSLVPLIYFHYHYQNLWNNHKDEYGKYLVRTSLSGVFGGTPDNLLDKLVKQINKERDFVYNEIVGVIREDGRNLEISQDIIINLNYWRKEIHLLFNLWYGFNYQPASSGNAPQIDHIFPQSVLSKIKKNNPETQRKSLMVFTWEKRDQIGNLMLLTAAENGAGGKTDILPEDWFANKDVEYLDLHLIPKDKELWKLENYDKFIEERKKLIIDKFNYLIIKKDSI